MHSGGPFVVGLTGGVGSGKSTAAELFATHGAYVVDADAISHQLTAAGGDAVGVIAEAFPGVVHNGVLDRPALRERVFAQPAERQRLEAIVHPLVRAATEVAMRSDNARRAPYVIHMVPLLFESRGYAERIDCAVLVDVDEATQVRRVSSTRGVPEATVRNIIAAQMPRRERMLRAQFIIDNEQDRPALALQVDALHRVLLANARRRFAAAADRAGDSSP